MKIKCRILSFGVMAIAVVVLIISAIFIARKDKNNIVYAKSIDFKGVASGVEIYIDNDLVINKDMVTITPADCTVSPEFTIEKSGETDEIIVTTEKYSFEEMGKYILSCKIKVNENNYIKDSIIINVVKSPTTLTSMYIKKLAKATLYVEDEINISSIAELVYPNLAKVDFRCSEHISINNEVITAIKDGLGIIDIILSCDNITITKSISIIVKPKVIESDIILKLTINGNELNENIVNITNTGFNFVINYELLNVDNQLINCWTNSNIIQIVNYDSPMIILKPLSSGEAIIYVSPLDYENTVFKIVVNVE